MLVDLLIVLDWAPQGLAIRTSEKQRPGPLELTLLFKAIPVQGINEVPAFHHF